TTVDDGLYHHVAVVRDRTSGTLRLYIDGSLDSEVTDNEADVGPTGSAYIGKQRPEYSPLISDGEIDEVRIWTAARYSSDFSPLRCEPLGPTTDLVAEWRFEEGAGTTISDSSGNGFDG